MFININGIIWSIHIVPFNHIELRNPDNSYSLGCCNTQQKAIYINSNLSGYQLNKVIRHEITHAIIYSYDISLNAVIEELLADFCATYNEEILYYFNKIKEKL